MKRYNLGSGDDDDDGDVVAYSSATSSRGIGGCCCCFLSKRNLIEVYNKTIKEKKQRKRKLCEADILILTSQSGLVLLLSRFIYVNSDENN